MKRFVLSFIAIICLQQFSLKAQSTSVGHDRVDAFVESLGSLPDFNVAVIADTLTRSFTAKEDKARAIFYWIANNIAVDPKATKSNDNRKTLPEQVVQLRKTTPLGFSLLIQEMCSWAKIRCLSVDGYLKNFPEEINNKPDEFNHSWNVVQLGQSPEEWFYIDASKASGSLDKKMQVFTKNFTSEYFFADKSLFNLDHYPDNTAWLLGPGPKSVKEFYSLPVISNAAYIYQLQKPKPATGVIKTKTKATVNFQFAYNDKKISSIVLLIGDGRKQSKPEPMNFTASGGFINFSYQFKIEDTYPVRIVVDGQDLAAYIVDSVE